VLGAGKEKLIADSKRAHSKRARRLECWEATRLNKLENRTKKFLAEIKEISR
jgi:hypothetical protein